VIFITLMGFAVGTRGAFGWIWGCYNSYVYEVAYYDFNHIDGDLLLVPWRFWID
jgi:hypothetical protein